MGAVFVPCPPSACGFVPPALVRSYPARRVCLTSPAECVRGLGLFLLIIFLSESVNSPSGLRAAAQREHSLFRHRYNEPGHLLIAIKHRSDLFLVMLSKIDVSKFSLHQILFRS